MTDDTLEPSELGTLEYWNDRYEKEVKSFAQRGDEGEVWFGEDIVQKIITWVESNIDTFANIVDIGCGNGHILTELARLNYKKLTGLDYSEPALKLAKAIAQKQELDIKYELNNVLEGLPDKYDLIHDKGTYDAICLSENSPEDRVKYIKSIISSLNEHGYFIITTCNWTADELVEHFKDYLDLRETLPTPTFHFGGKVGHVVSICVFKKIL